MIPRLLLGLLLALPLPALATEPLSIQEFVGKATPITLSQAIFLALSNNLDLELARTGPNLAREAVKQARGGFDLSLSASHGFEHREVPQANFLNTIFTTSFDRLDEDEWNSNTALGGVLPWGMEYSTAYNMRRLQSNSPFASLTREWRSSWINQITIPLLRNLSQNELHVSVKRSQLAEAISQEDFRQQLSDLIVTIEGAYWELAASHAETRVAQKSLQSAQDLLSQTNVQYDVGVVSKVSVAQAEAGVAERELDAILAKNRSENAQDQLLDLVLAPGAAEFAQTRLIPRDPEFVPYEAVLNDVLERALENRPEIRKAKRVVEDAQVQLDFSKNQRLPSLDVKASYSMSGLSGRPETTKIRNSSFAANDDFFRARGAKGYALSGEFSIPLGNHTARSVVVQRQIELRRARTDLRRAKQQVVREVRQAVRNLKSASEALQATEHRRLAQQETLRAEQEKLRLGDSTPHDVLVFEKDLAAAERQKIVSLQQYRNAITTVEHGQATLLSNRGVSIEGALEQ